MFCYNSSPRWSWKSIGQDLESSRQACSDEPIFCESATEKTLRVFGKSAQEKEKLSLCQITCPQLLQWNMNAAPATLSLSSYFG
mmetsp:Transcript_25521/g.37965  ORF Transcript_25521/g.37965 Transcript_25521/m.37965 type:complete len:84 (+) Transcript_25521:2-253(+)